MASALTSQLAIRIASRPPSTDIMLAVLELANPGRTCNRVLGLPAPANAVAELAERGAHLAALVAGSPVQDPEILRSLASSKSATVRRALAGNPAVPADTLVDLMRQAIERPDLDVLSNLAGTLPPSTYLPILLQATKSGAIEMPELVPDKIAGQLRNTADSDELTFAFTCDEVPHLRQHLVAESATGSLPLDPAALIRLAAENQLHLAITALAVCLAVDADMAQLLAETVPDPDNPAEPSAAWIEEVRHGLALPKATNIDRDAVEILIAAGNPELDLLLTHAATQGHVQLTSSQLADIAGRADEDTRRTLLTAARLLDAEQIEHLAAETRPLSAWVVDRILQQEWHRLNDAATAALLISSESQWPATHWARGEYGTPPTMNVLTIMAASWRDSPWYPNDAMSGDVPTDLCQVLIDDIDMAELSVDSAVQRFFDEMLNKAGRYTLTLAASSGDLWAAKKVDRAAEYVTRRLHERFADDATAWRLALEAADVLKVGTIDDWLNLTDALRG